MSLPSSPTWWYQWKIGTLHLYGWKRCQSSQHHVPPPYRVMQKVCGCVLTSLPDSSPESLTLSLPWSASICDDCTEHIHICQWHSSDILGQILWREPLAQAMPGRHIPGITQRFQTGHHSHNICSPHLLTSFVFVSSWPSCNTGAGLPNPWCLKIFSVWNHHTHTHTRTEKNIM